MGTTPHVYTDEEKAFLREWVYGHSRKEITEEFNRRFNHDFSVKRVTASMKRYGGTTGRTGYFPKGNAPHNKGKKMPPDIYKKCKGTMFKKGQIPTNHRPVGSERVNVDGYLEIKIAEPNKWTLKHNYAWEQANGKIPKGHVVIFLDGDVFNLSLDNLKCISRAEHLYLNRNGLRFDNKELTGTAVNIAKLECIVAKKNKE